jgi:hypothetical protein
VIKDFAEAKCISRLFKYPDFQTQQNVDLIVFPFADKQFAIQPRVPKNSTNFTNLKNPMLVKNKLKTK